MITYLMVKIIYQMAKILYLMANTWSMSQVIQRELSFSSKNSTPS